MLAADVLLDFPAMVPLWTMPLAVITGNTMIIKPSEQDPGAVMILAELATKAGFPPGVINIIHGTVKSVDFIIDEPAIKAISFVGSNKAGEYIFTRGSANGKRVQANLGAKNHALVMPDCNKNHAIGAIVGAAFGAAGQRCMALSTIVTVGETTDWLPELVAKARELNVNGGFEKGAELGPVISPQAKQRIESLIASAEEEGATIMLDGRGFKPEKYPNGNFVKHSPSQNSSYCHADSFCRLDWSDSYCKREASYEMLQGRNLWPSARLSRGQGSRLCSRNRKQQ